MTPARRFRVGRSVSKTPSTVSTGLVRFVRLEGVRLYERYCGGVRREDISGQYLLDETRRGTVIGGLFSVVVGSALGGVSRYFLSGVIARSVGETFPWGTLVVNITGAYLIGLFGGLATDNTSLLGSSDLWLLAVTGFCGGYTTVSSFSLQTLALARDGERARAAAYVVLSVVLCLVAVAAGFASVGR